MTTHDHGLLAIGLGIFLGIGAYGACGASFANSHEDLDAASAGKPVWIVSPVAEAGAATNDDARLAVSKAEAELADTVREVRGLFAKADRQRRRIAAREAALQSAQNDYRRCVAGLRDGTASLDELAQTKKHTAAIRSGLGEAQRELRSTMAQVGGYTIATHPRIVAAGQAVRTATLALERSAAADRPETEQRIDRIVYANAHLVGSLALSTY